MKSYMISLLVIGIALGGLGLGTFAYFTDSENADGNIIQAGTADLGVFTTPSATGWTDLNLSATGLEPGEYDTAGYIVLKNDGTTDLKWRGYLVKKEGTLPSMSKLMIRLTVNPDDYSGYIPSGYTEWGLDNVAAEYTWSQTNVIDTSELNSGDSSPMLPKTYQVFKVEVGLASDAGDNYQGTDATIDAIFQATQFANLGWTA